MWGEGWNLERDLWDPPEALAAEPTFRFPRAFEVKARWCSYLPRTSIFFTLSPRQKQHELLLGPVLLDEQKPYPVYLEKSAVTATGFEAPNSLSRSKAATLSGGLGPEGIRPSELAYVIDLR